MKDNSYLTWLEDAKSLFDKYQVGWAWVAYSPGRDSSIPAPLRSPITMILVYTVTITSVSPVAPQLPPIPGFTGETILAGFLLGFTALALKRRRNRHRVSRLVPYP